MVEGLREAMALGCGAEPLLAQADVLDAAVCVLAGADFLAGRALGPEAMSARIRREGWIWIRRAGPA